MRNIKLMADYGCFPLWEATEKSLVNLNPEDLDLPKELSESLDQWASDYEATLNRGNPVISEFSSKEDGHKFEIQGRQLHQKLKKQLGLDFHVTYFSAGESKLYE